MSDIRQPSNADITQRLLDLEERVKDIVSALHRLEPKIDALKDVPRELAQIRGQLTNMPTLPGIIGTMLAVNAGIIAIAGWRAWP